MKPIINRSNYEAYWLDLLEGNLSVEEEAALQDFLQAHPELEAELEEVAPIEFLQSEKGLVNKDSLKKAIVPTESITELNWEEKLMHHFEGEETIPAQEFRTFKSGNPFLKKEIKAFEQARVSSDQSVVFPNKEALKKKATPVFSIQTRVILTTVAASMLVFLYLRIPQGDGSYVPRQFLSPVLVADIFEPTKIEIKEEMDTEIAVERALTDPSMNDVVLAAIPNQDLPSRISISKMNSIQTIEDIELQVSTNQLAIAEVEAEPMRLASTYQPQPTNANDSYTLKQYLIKSGKEKLNQVSNDALAFSLTKESNEDKKLKLRLGRLSIEHQF